MNLVAKIEARLVRIFNIVERIEQDREDEMVRTGKIITGSCTTPAEIFVTLLKSNEAPGVMNLSTTRPKSPSI